MDTFQIVPVYRKRIEVYLNFETLLLPKRHQPHDYEL